MGAIKNGHDGRFRVIAELAAILALGDETLDSRRRTWMAAENAFNHMPIPMPLRDFSSYIASPDWKNDDRTAGAMPNGKSYRAASVNQLQDKAGGTRFRWFPLAG